MVRSLSCWSPRSLRSKTIRAPNRIRACSMRSSLRAASSRSRKDQTELKYGDIALLFRAMTQVQIYESVFRRANIPYQTVLGRGFYEREEITDLIQLLRFLDNKTDELALAAVLAFAALRPLRQRVAGVALRAVAERSRDGDPLRGFSATRPLYTALRHHEEIAFISDGRTRAARSRGEVDRRARRSPASLSDSGSAAFRG